MKVTDKMAASTLPTLHNYFRYYGLERDPFASIDTLSQASQFFYPGAGRKQALEQLQHLSRYSQLLLLVTGDTGCGKTSLCKTFLETDHSGVDDCFIQADLMMSAEQTLRTIAHKLNLNITENASKQECIYAIESYAHDLAAEPRTCRIIVEDAHELGEDALAALFSLAGGNVLNNAQPHVVLFGNEQLNHNVDEHQLRQQSQVTCHHIELHPFNEAEVQGYLDYSIREAANQQGHHKVTFSRKQFEKIVKGSAGYPGKINRIAKQLLFNAVSESGLQQLGLPMGHMAAIIVIGSALLLSVFMNNKPESPDIMSNNGSATLVELIKNSEETIEEKVELTAYQEESEKEHVVSPFSDEQQDSRIKVISTNAVAQLAKEISPPAVKINTQTTVEKVSVLPVKEKEPVKLVIEKAVTNLIEDDVNHEDWIMTLSNGKYTLQLLGSHSEQSVIEFIANQADEKEFAYFETAYKSQGWYVVVFGEFDDREAAMAALPRLPKDLREMKPWVRSVESIQDDIRKQRG